MQIGEVVIAGHLCSVHPSDQYSAIVDLEIYGDSVRLCFAKDERPEWKQRIMKNLIDAYEQRIRHS